MKAFIDVGNNVIFFDTVDKYGAGLALEVLGESLHELAVSNNDVVISNELGWLLSEDNTVHKPLFQWWTNFYSLCNDSGISPAVACIYFSLHIPRIGSLALNSSTLQRVQQNIASANVINSKNLV